MLWAITEARPGAIEVRVEEMTVARLAVTIEVRLWRAIFATR